MTALTERERKILEVALAHRGRYLLPRRYGKISSDDEVNQDYAACEALVASGYARWLAYSSFSPGIRLTGKDPA